MTDTTLQVAVVVGATTVVGALITTIGSIIIKKLELGRQEIKAYRKEVNGHLTNLIETQRALGNREGNVEGRAQNQAETDLKPQKDK